VLLAIVLELLSTFRMVHCWGEFHTNGGQRNTFETYPRSGTFHEVAAITSHMPYSLKLLHTLAESKCPGLLYTGVCGSK
jgi:hypothetical protein